MAEKDYRKIFSNLLKDMIDGHQEPTVNEEHFNHVVFADFTINDFNSLMLEDLDDQNSEFWKYLTNFMYNEYSNIGHQPIYETDFSDDKNSIISYLSNKIDIDSNQNWASIWANLKQQFAQGGGTWNPSVNEALNKFLTILADKIYIKGHEGDQNAAYIAINDIKRGNAGNAFENALATLSGDWVRPNNNADNEMYRQVRGQDAIHSVLNSHENLQFTHSQNQDGVISAWLRLIMPKYLRTVEVEDLNRNFWVLGQVISAISAFLFDPENSFASLFEDILSEIVQLWENVLYLWLAYMISSQKKTITDIHIEVVPITVNEYENFIKFDNFEPEETFTTLVRTNGVTSFNDAEDFQQKIKDRCKYIIQQYGDSNVIIFPKIRYENYKHNYYIAERWPCMLLYNVNTKEYKYVGLFTAGSHQPIVFDTFSDTIMKRTWAVKEDEFQYSFVPATTAHSDSPYKNEPYYILLRIIPEVNATYDEENNCIKVNSFSVNSYDVSYNLVDETYQSDFRNEITHNSFRDYNYPNENWYSYSSGATSLVNYSGTLPIQTDINKGYYQGEFPSYPCYRDADPDEPPPVIIINPLTAALNVEEVELLPLNLIEEDLSELFDVLTDLQDNPPQDPIAIQEDMQKKFERRWIRGFDEASGMDASPSSQISPYSLPSPISGNTEADRLYFPSTIPLDWRGNQNFQYSSVGEDIILEGQGRQDTPTNDYFKSFYYYNGQVIVDSLKKNNDGISGDCYTLYKYAQEMNLEPVSGGDVKFSLLIGKHSAQLYGGWNGGQTYFGAEHLDNQVFYSNNGEDLVEERWGYTGSDPEQQQIPAYRKIIKEGGTTTALSRSDLPAIQYYPWSGHGLSNAAVLYRYPIPGEQGNGNIITYTDFKREIPGPSCFLVYNVKYSTAILPRRVFFLRHDVPGMDKGVITEDNWICLYIQVSGGKRPLGDKTNSAHPAHYTMDTEDIDKTEQTIITRISMYFLFPDGKCVFKIIDRHHGHGLTERVRGKYNTLKPASVNQDPWIINQMNSEGRVTSNTFTTWKVKYYGSFGNNNQTVFETLYNNNTNNLLLNETIENGQVTQNSTEHVFNGVNYHFYFADNTDEQNESIAKFDPVQFPNTLYKQKEEAKNLSHNYDYGPWGDGQ